jgi:serine/threonine-protein kinase
LRLLGRHVGRRTEQAQGEIANLDERCDVFALGAILCEILTGRPPYVGGRAEVLQQAREARLDEAFARLDACEADVELARLARRCLAPARDDRPRDAGVVAREVGAYLASIEERARAAELAAAEARARVEAERRARRLTVGLGLATLMALLIGGVGYLQAERARLTAREEHLLAERESLRAEREHLRAEHQRQASIEAALGALGKMGLKSRWIVDQATTAPESEARKWAELLKLTREVAERSAADAPDEESARQANALVADLRAAEAAARARAARATQGQETRPD